MVSNDEIRQEMDRDRGILSESDRKWLLTPRDEFIEDHSRQYWGQRRDEIKNRIQNSILDFSLLYNHLDEEIQEEIFGEAPNLRGYVSPEGGLDSPYLEGIRDALAFFMSSLLRKRDTEEAIANKRGYEATFFGELLEAAIKQVGIRHDVLIDEIDPMTFHGRRAPGIEQTIERAEEGKELSGSEIELLRKSGRLDEEEFLKAVQKAIKDPD